MEYKPWHLWYSEAVIKLYTEIGEEDPFCRVYRRGIATEDLKKYEGEVISSEVSTTQSESETGEISKKTRCRLYLLRMRSRIRIW